LNIFNAEKSVVSNVNKKFELMLTRCVKAYGSSIQ